jgi:mono/diheme cytochrome c family protein
MRTVLKWIGRVVLVFLAGAVVAVLWAFLTSNAQANKEYDVETAELSIPTDAESIAEGKRLVAIRACGDCHGADMGGMLLVEDPALGAFYGTNISGGEGSPVAGYTPREWDLAIRHGVGPDNKPLVFMPSTDYYRISDEDLAMMIAYLESVPEVDQSWPEQKVGPMARALVAAGQLPFSADLIDHSVAPPESVTKEVSAEYGEYLATTCTGCHLPNFSGGETFPGAPPETPPSANLTPAGHLGSWTQEDFIRTMRTGVTPEGHELNPE